jgi:hypothetical protein
MNLINRSSDYELLDLGNKLGLQNLIVCSKSDLPKYLSNKKIKNIIFNMGNSTHWVALYKPKKLYFDSYAQPMPSVVPKNYKRSSTNKEIESIDGNNCGQLACLYLYYVNYKTQDEYYKLFKDLY